MKKYDAIFCSSQKAVNFFESQVVVPVYLLPLASDLDKYKPANAERTKVIFIGNRWSEQRSFEDLQEKDIDFDFEIYGNGWENSPFAKYSKGPISNDLVASKYREAAIVLDAANDTTKEWESVNSRIFNAIACGALPITDSKATNKLLVNNIPSFESPTELLSQIKKYLNNPTLRKEEIIRCHQELKAKHSYDHRANQFYLALCKKLNISIKIGAPNQVEAAHWGDSYFARALKKYLERNGHEVRIDTQDSWYSEKSLHDDLNIVLHGLGQYKPNSGSKNFLWVISHPENFESSFFEDYDHIFFASMYHYDQFKDEHGTKASCLLQCTDHEIFFPRQKDKEYENENLYIGNSRDVYREGVKYSIESKIPISIIGGGWDKFVPSKALKSIFAPNDTLPYYYSGCKVLINDHWDDMKKFGYISNRVFDAGACGTNIISDRPKNVEVLFGSHLSYYDDAITFLKAIAQSNSANQTPNLELSLLIRTQHTFEQRVNTILNTFFS